MSVHKIPADEIHELALYLTKQTPINRKPWEHSQIIDEFMKIYNSFYDALLKYNEKSE